KGGQTYKLVYDQVGSVREVVAQDGSVAELITYDEFGNILADSAPMFQPFGFGGGHRDTDTTLSRFSARDYDPTTGRWTTIDPIGNGSSRIRIPLHASACHRECPVRGGPSVRRRLDSDSRNEGRDRSDASISRRSTRSLEQLPSAECHTLRRFRRG